MKETTFFTVIIAISALLPVSGEAMESPPFSGGLCIVIGDVDTAFAEQYGTNNCVVHMLSEDLDGLSVARKSGAQWRKRGAKCHASLWSGEALPYADSLANVILVGSSSEIPESELLRVLQPGGVAILGSGNGGRSIQKPEPEGIDQWTHPWHGASGGLASYDQVVEVPTGIQWVHGPLYPMAGRKSSTQCVVTAGGRHFSVTQNVVDNIGEPNMVHYLIARNAYNGLVLWQFPWKGLFANGFGELNPRIVASADRVYAGWFGGIEVFNAVDGAPIERIDVSGPVTKLIMHNNSLLVQCESGLACHALSDGPAVKAWELKEGGVEGVAADGERVYVLGQKRAPDGKRGGELVCVSLRDGKVQWRIGTDALPAGSARLRICFANDGYVALIAHGSLHVLRGETGEHLWSQTTSAKPGKSYADERYVGHFYRRGLVWMQLENSPRGGTLLGQAVWAAFDPETGKEQRRMPTTGAWPRTANPAKMGCQLMSASDRYILISRQATFVDFETGEKHSFKFMRGACGSGFVPANGLVYSSPHGCGCYTEVVRGFLAAHSLPVPDASLLTKEERLSRFSDGAVSIAVEVATDDWPMHRYDGTRSAASPTKIPDSLAQRWAVSVGRPLTAPSGAAWRIRSGMSITAPVIVGDRVYVCDVEDHRVVAIDDATGDVCWQFIADGRIDSPPTISEGRCLFGCHDGYVYCLRAEDGALLWRYLVAPLDRRIVAFGQVESAWPVAGSVLVRDRVAYAAAGRAPDADGGITIVALDTRTGEALWSAKSKAEMVGMCDYLVAGGDQVFLANLGFDLKTGECTPAKTPSHLRGGKAGLLEASWLDAGLALRKSIHTWTARGAAGELLAMGAQDAFGCKAGSALFRSGSQAWSVSVKAPRQVRALALTGSHLLSASAKAGDAPGGILTLSNTEDGATVTEVELPAPPVFDGLAAAHERVYISLANGTLLSMGRPD